MAPIFLTLGEVIEIHKDQIDNYGGKPGIRDLGLLKSALAMPAAGLHDRYLHNDLFEMATAYLYHIVQNHPFWIEFLMLLLTQTLKPASCMLRRILLCHP